MERPKAAQIMFNMRTANVGGPISAQEAEDIACYIEGLEFKEKTEAGDLANAEDALNDHPHPEHLS